MSLNRVHTVKRDEVNKQIHFTLTDANGAVNLTPYTITMTLKKDGTVVTSAAPVTKEDQTTNTGECYHVWAANTIPDTAGEYQGELKLVAGSTVLYWPVNRVNDSTYFTVIVQDPLA